MRWAADVIGTDVVVEQDVRARPHTITHYNLRPASARRFELPYVTAIDYGLAPMSVPSLAAPLPRPDDVGERKPGERGRVRASPQRRGAGDGANQSRRRASEL